MIVTGLVKGESLPVTSMITIIMIMMISDINDDDVDDQENYNDCYRTGQRRVTAIDINDNDDHDHDDQ